MNNQVELRMDKLKNNRYIVIPSTKDAELSTKIHDLIEGNKEYIFKGIKTSDNPKLFGYTLLQSEKIKSRVLEKFHEANINVTDIGIVDVMSR